MATKHSNGNGSASKGTRAALYLRMSSDQQVESIPQQRDQLVAYAAKHGYQIVTEFEDSGISGDATERRSGFLAMRDAAASNEFSVVLAWDSDRIGRWDLLSGGYWLHPFRQAGIVFETVAQGRVDLEGLNGQLLYSVNQLAKHQYLIDLSRNVSRGSLAAARNSKRHGHGGGGPRLFGYTTTEAGEVEIVDTEAEIVRRIFREYLAPGSSLRSVAIELNQDGAKTASGKNWTVSRVRSMLTNRKYCGCYTRFKTASGKYHAIVDGEIVSRTRTDKAVRQDPLVVVEGNHRAIIDQADFDAVQDRLAGNQTETAPKESFPYILRGLLRCSACGGSMSGYARRAYICSTYHRAGSAVCHSNYIAEDRLISGVVKLIKSRYCSAARIEELREAVRSELADEQKQVTKQDQDQRRLTKRISILDQQLDQAAGRVLTAPAAVVDRLTNKLAELQAERDRLQSELDAGECTETTPQPLDNETVELAIESLRKLSERLGDDDPGELRQTLNDLIVRIELEFDHAPEKGGKRIKNILSGGLILLRTDLALSSKLFTNASR